MRTLKGRGAQLNPSNKFIANSVEADPDYFEHLNVSGEELPTPVTEFIHVHPKSIVNKVASPDLGFEYSMNPYQGCEHGCIYCYARNSHEYWGYSAGTDFESKVLVKTNAASLLEQKLDSRSWQVKPIMLSGNTDCYQPIEKKLEITRQLLKVFLDCRQPVGIITKNALILRDLDLLKELAQHNLVKVVISITSLKDSIKNIMEPRTSSVKQKLKAVKTLSENEIPVTVMMAPLIPSINSSEIVDMAETVAQHGAIGLKYTIIRLNGVLPVLFSDWLAKNFPDRKEKVLNQIKDLHGGKLSDSRFGKRMSGEGEYSSNISQLFAMATKRHGLNQPIEPYNCDLFRKPSQRQLNLF